MKPKFTKHDVGCYADGAYGHEHVRRTVADLVRTYCNNSELASALKNEMSDSADEEFEAKQELNALCDDDVHFEFVDGAFMLVYTGDPCPDCNGQDGHRRGCLAEL